MLDIDSISRIASIPRDKPIAFAFDGSFLWSCAWHWLKRFDRFYKCVLRSHIQDLFLQIFTIFYQHYYKCALNIRKIAIATQKYRKWVLYVEHFNPI